MARLTAYECENEGCDHLYRKEDRTRVTVSTKKEGDPPKTTVKDVCPPCAEQFSVARALKSGFGQVADSTKPDVADPVRPGPA